MMNMKSVLSIAMAETRVTRRLVRYWLFLGFSYLLVFIVFLYYSTLHGLFSTYSATVGLISPRNLASVMGLYYLIIYCIGVVFLAFDVRARDKRERMYEVLDSRPYTNLELVSGRFLGILIPAWVPIVILGILLELLGFILRASGSPIGEPVEINSLLTFTFLMSLPALSIMISVVFLFTLLIRNRLASAIVLLLFLGGCYVGLYLLPVYIGQLLDIPGFLNIELYSSDITSSFFDAGRFLLRGGMLIASLGILGLCAAVHPRLDDGSRSRSAMSGIVILLVAAAMVGGAYLNDVKNFSNKDMWLNAHGEYSDYPVQDIKKISGDVNIVPGKSLDLDIKISFSAPESESLSNAIFTLNPGQEVTELLDSSGRSLNFTSENGLLNVTLAAPLSPGEETGISLKIRGIPDKNFAYLDSIVDRRKLQLRNVNIDLLGNQNIIYDSNFVALMPALRWLPAAGPLNGKDDHNIRATDYFNVDLNVSLPKGWLVAGPGRRNLTAENADGNVFRFSPLSVVPEVALIASEFESRSFETDNIVFELLIHKKHLKNIEILSDTEEKIKEYIESTIKEAKENELFYPYDGLTLVEIPTVLRTYGGGWRLDTIQALPGVLLLKELSLPTSRFDSAFRKPENFKNMEGGIVQAKWERLQTYFKNDFAGGNVFTGVSKDFFLFQTSSSGPEGQAVNFVMDTLTGLVITDTKGYFSAHILIDPMGINKMTNPTLRDYFQRRGIGETVMSAAIKLRTSQPIIWEKTLETSLRDMDPWKDPEDMVDVLALKGYAVADSIYKTLGREKTASLLATIRKNHVGGSFTAVEMINAGRELGYDMDEQLGDWIGGTGLPGFIISDARGYRVADDENGAPRYQLFFTVRNDEPVPGVFNFAYYYQAENQNSELTKSEPINLAGKHAIQYGTIVSRTPTMCFLQPYLSFNRGTFEIQMNNIDPQKIVKEEIIEGVHEIPWEVPVSSSVTVDDLDDGFNTVTEGKDNKGLRLKTKERTGNDRDTDQGLPFISATILPPGARAPREWSRITSGVAYGKYRHTAAIIRHGDGDKKAQFQTSLPANGAWDLEIYIPNKSLFPGKKWGAWHAVVTDNNGDKHEVEFDSNAGSGGWNLAGRLDLPDGNVTVELSNMTDGDLVVADAIRLTPAAAN